MRIRTIPLVQWRARRSHTRSDIDEFRARALQEIILGLPAITLAIVGAFAVNYDGTPIELATLIPFPIALAIIGHDLLSRRPALASAAVVGGLLALVTIAVWLQPGSLLATFYGLVVLIAGATGGALAGFLTAGLAVILLTLAYLAAPARVDLPLLLASATIAAACAGLSRVATGPIHVALEWAWQSYDESRRVTEELRDRQIALGRALKSLNEAYLQLEHLNDELARARQAAEEARRLKAQFAANISHELRTPLNLIIGFAEMMATVPQAYEGHSLPEVYRRDLEAILRNARHLAGLIDDVLELSQIEAGRMGSPGPRCGGAAACAWRSTFRTTCRWSTLIGPGYDRS